MPSVFIFQYHFNNCTKGEERAIYSGLRYPKSTFFISIGTSSELFVAAVRPVVNIK
jgi:hypothetical protein